MAWLVSCAKTGRSPVPQHGNGTGDAGWNVVFQPDVATGCICTFSNILVLTGISIYGLINLHNDIKQKTLGNNSIIMALLMCCWGGGSLILIRELDTIPDGRVWILLLFAMVWCGDAGAMHVGKLLGRHKLTPIISPKKTVEGLIGGIIIATAAAWIVHHYLKLPIPLWHLWLLAPATVLLAHVGRSDRFHDEESRWRQRFRPYDSRAWRLSRPLRQHASHCTILVSLCMGLRGMKNIVLLGCTGSIGTQTLNVAGMFPDRFAVTGISAKGRDPELLADIIRRFVPQAVVDRIGKDGRIVTRDG